MTLLPKGGVVVVLGRWGHRMAQPQHRVLRGHRGEWHDSLGWPARSIVRIHHNQIYVRGEYSRSLHKKRKRKQFCNLRTAFIAFIAAFTFLLPRIFIPVLLCQALITKFIVVADANIHLQNLFWSFVR